MITCVANQKTKIVMQTVSLRHKDNNEDCIKDYLCAKYRPQNARVLFSRNHWGSLEMIDFIFWW